MEEKKRVLKSLYNRMPDNKITKKKLQKLMRERVGKSGLNPKGLKMVQINDFMDELINVITEQLSLGNSVQLADLMVLYPYLKPPKPVVKMRSTKDNMKGAAKKGAKAELTWMGARWVVKMKISKTLKEHLLKRDPTEEEIENIYRD